MKSLIKNIFMASSLALVAGGFASCSLDEENPGGFELGDLALTKTGYEELLNQCFFGLESTY